MVTDHDLVTTSGVAIVKEDATPSFWIGALLKGRLKYDVIFVAICTAEKEHVVHNASSINSKAVLVVMLKRILCYTRSFVHNRKDINFSLFIMKITLADRLFYYDIS